MQKDIEMDQSSSVDLTSMVVNNLESKRNNLPAFEGNETHFSVNFEHVFDENSQTKISNTIATLPSPMWIYFKTNKLLKNNTLKETKLHMMYGYLLSWYRTKSITDEIVLKKLISDKNSLLDQVKGLKDIINTSYCNLHDIECNETNDLTQLQDQAKYLSAISEEYRAIPKRYQEYMNIEDRRVARLLETHSLKDTCFLVSFHKFCINKYQEWLKLDKHYFACPEEDFEGI